MDITTVFQLLSDETRLRILLLLLHQDLCVCELTEIMKESQPKISKHMAKLRTHKLVLANRNEQYIYYSLNPDNELLINQLQLLQPSLQDQEPYQSDLNVLQTITEFVCTRG
ncbi:ArsR/SmtB family transcription factor [Candidatus Xianfuyuplasma coldseepsis]|uniref:Metalloregulator ArsR/SmtB family transcription factor n=1 Tax=Candidatus Xianfuyuplasma coldseepsis TaxID=2782163 RepID=A0A7L7KPY6_9MOLU|nr:metalloregulator ArsR/SmtB family transcription factor [Xianfuyuplasma coldseepsis]QMS84635.1 metalloregulator ArsR/SmtB family transcription factor [Xianfuyuplasma coldseepsis]